MSTFKYNLEWLLTCEDIKQYTYFWGHTPKRKDVVDKSCLSQWFPVNFKDADGNVFYNAEQYMMYWKALLFSDLDSADLIYNESDPKKVKDLGRRVKNFNAKIWDDSKHIIVYRGNLLKFSQNDHLLSFLLSTDDSVLVEASPYDKIWGIGMGSDEARTVQPSDWKGLNLLGFALMNVRWYLEQKHPTIDI